MLVTAVMSWRLLGPVAVARVAGRVPIGRLLLICVAVLCVASIANAASLTLRLGLLVAAAAAITLMVRLDVTAELKLFPSGLLSLHRTIGKAFWMIFLLGMSTIPTNIFMPLLLQTLHGITPAVAGYFYAEQSIAWTLASFVVARFTGRRVRLAIVGGPLIMAAGLGTLHWTISTGPVPAIAVALFLVGTGIGTCWAHVANAVLLTGREEEKAVTASVVPTAQMFAAAFGAAIAGVIANAAGLASGASQSAAAVAGAALFGSFAFAPLTAGLIATRLARARDIMK
jgi:hypothetical protein